ncbi:DUF222 domain-containing protein [Mycolicibacterium sp. A43C]
MKNTMAAVEAEERAAWQAVDNIGAEAREENACGARRLFAIGQLYDVRAPDDDTEKLCWAIDGHSSLVAEVAAALTLSRCRAAAQVRMAIALYTRLPRVLATAKSGLLDYRMLAAIVSRTELIQDPEILARVDERLAEKAVSWVRLSEPKIEARINAVIAAQDPEAVRIRDQIRRDREIGGCPNGDGTAEIWGRIDLAALAAMNAVLDAMADSVCPTDPRTRDQRRSDAFFAVFIGKPLTCRCGQSGCPAEPLTVSNGVPCASLIVHLVADSVGGVGIVPGYGHIGLPAVDEARRNARVRTVEPAAITVEAGRFPSTTLGEFIRCRDLTYRFPGCDVPAWNTDIDHTVPYPAGPTHPSNLKCLCRAHHLLKTFHDWRDTQLANGTVVWTSPTGHVYTTEPEGGHWFTGLGDPTGEPSLQPSLPGNAKHCLKTPTRDRSRAEDRTRRITAERAANRCRVDEQERQEHARIDAHYEPPPF